MMQLDVQRGVARQLGSAVRSAAAVGGGDINEAFEVDLDDGRRVFVKVHAGGIPGMGRGPVRPSPPPTGASEAR